jgi:predicted transcriptional regulator
MRKPDEITEKGKKLLRSHAFLVRMGRTSDIMWGGDGQVGVLRSAKRLVRQGYLWTNGGSMYDLTDKGMNWCREYLASKYDIPQEAPHED